MIRYIFIALIFVLGSIIMVDDIRYRKIKNKFIITGLVLGGAAFIFFWTRGMVATIYLENVLINTAIAAVISFVLWEMLLWPAGDAKLFILLTFLLPLEFYNNGYLEYFPAFIFLTNCFIVFLIFLFFKALFLFSRDVILKSGEMGLGLYLSHVLRNIVENLRQRLRDWRKTIRNLARIMLVALVYMLIGRFYMHRQFDIFNFFLYFIIFASISALFKYYVDGFTRSKIPADALRARMNLSAKTAQKIRKIPELARKIGVLRPEGLSQEQAENLAKFSRLKSLDPIYIYKTIPFAPWIIIGLLVTMLLRDNVLKLIF